MTYKQNSRYRRLKEKGICTYCNKNKAYKKYSVCKSCHEKITVARLTRKKERPPIYKKQVIKNEKP